MTSPNTGGIWDPTAVRPEPSEFGGGDGMDLGAAEAGFNPMPDPLQLMELHKAFEEDPAGSLPE
jgi:hypothetical protein